MQNRIQNILFDLGNVLVRFDWDIALRRLSRYLPPELLRLLAEDKEAFKRLFHEPATSLEIGKIDFDRFHRIMSDRLGVNIGKADFYRIWCDIFELDEDMAALGMSLSKRYDTWLVSNTSQAHYEWIIEKFPGVLFYKDAALSFEFGVMKPSEKYYSQLIDKFCIDPGRSVFIDDLEENVDGAIRAGMAGIVFQGRRKLVVELEILGLNVAQEKEQI